MDAIPPEFLLPTVLLAVAGATVAYVLVDIMVRERKIDPQLGRFEVERRTKLRALSATYRWFEPWIDELSASLEAKPKGLEKVQGDLVGAGYPMAWKASEFWATKRVEAVFAAVGGLVFGWNFAGWTMGAMGAIGGFMIYEAIALRVLHSEAVRRQIKLKRRFATVIDLMALMMEVGSGFQEALQVAANENKGHPLGDELALVRRDIQMGQRDDALRAFAKRVQDDDVTEFVVGVIEGEHLGTPLAKIFRILAEQMREKRSQWAEKASGEAEVALVFPAMLVMVACLVIVAAPFVLTAVINPGG